MNELLDKKTLAAVIAASPDLPTGQDTARLVVMAMAEYVDKSEYPWINSILVEDLKNMVEPGHLCQELTASAVGSILRRLGLTGQRTRDGYRYYWTIEQLSILTHALKVEDPSTGMEGSLEGNNAKEIVAEQVPS